MKTRKQKPKGFTLIELIVAAAIFMILIGGVATAAAGSHLSDLHVIKKIQAQTALEQGWEALRQMKSDDWSQLNNGQHGLQKTNGVWTFNGTQDVSNGITRMVDLSQALRDESGQLVTAGGQIDPDTKWVEIAVTWNPTQSQTQSQSITTLITRYAEASAWPPEQP